MCPPLSFEAAPEISFLELLDLFRINLKPKDFAQVTVIQRFIDLYNLRAFYLRTPFDPRGSFSKEEFQEIASVHVGLEEYILDYLQHYEDKEERLHHFPALIAAYFQNEREEKNGFLQEYLRFEHEWRLVQTLFRAKKLGRDLIGELQFEEMDDPFVAQLIAQKDTKSAEAPEGYGEIKDFFLKHGEQPLELFRALLEYRFNKMEEIKGENSFSLDALLAYMVQLLIVERWQEAKAQSGKEMIDTILKAVK